MRVWLIQRAEPTPDDNRGSQRLMRTGILAKLLDDYGHEVIWWTSDYDHYNKIHRNGCDFRSSLGKRSSIQYIKSIGYSKRSPISFKRFIDMFLLAKRFSKLAKKEKHLPDIILVSIPTANLAKEAVKFGKTKNIPVVLDVRDLWPDAIYDVIPSLIIPLVRILFFPYIKAMNWSAKHATAIIGISKSFVNWGLNCANKDPSDNDIVFPMGYNKKIVNKDLSIEASRYWDKNGIFSKNNELIVVFFGKLGRQFSMETIIDCAKKLQNSNSRVKFVICGDGENFTNLKLQTKKLKNILLTGWISESYLRVLMQRSDIGLAPYIQSKSFYSAMGNKPSEYLSGKLPIALSLEKGETFNIINKYECGFSYKNNSQILYEKLIYLKNNPLYLKKISNNAFNTFKHFFDANIVYGKMINYLSDISESKLKYE